tara:strand:- start:985 stop:1338 length:354 start_codon:yes stop_codon:yes gene_type:complete
LYVYSCEWIPPIGPCVQGNQFFFVIAVKVTSFFNLLSVLLIFSPLHLPQPKRQKPTTVSNEMDKALALIFWYWYMLIKFPGTPSRWFGHPGLKICNLLTYKTVASIAFKSIVPQDGA